MVPFWSLKMNNEEFWLTISLSKDVSYQLEAQGGTALQAFSGEAKLPDK